MASLGFNAFAPYLGDPLVLSGFALFLFFVALRLIVRRLPPVRQRVGGIALIRLITFGFVLALVTIILGFGLKYSELQHNSEKLKAQYRAQYAEISFNRLQPELDKLTKNLDAILIFNKSMADVIEALVNKKESNTDSALKALSEKKIAEAKAYFRRITQAQDADNQALATAFRHLGALTALEDKSESITAYEQAVRLEPNNPQGWTLLIHLYRETGQPEKASRARRKVAELTKQVNTKGNQSGKFEILPNRLVNVLPMQVIQQCEFCPKMVVIASGQFRIGSSLADIDAKIADFDEISPDNEISIPQKFAIGQSEITLSEFRAFVAKTNYSTEAELSSKGCRTYQKVGRWDWSKNANWRNPEFDQDEDHPVTCITWNDANSYLKWLSEETNHRYRLPTEAEWEYAARATIPAQRYWTGNDSTACAYVNLRDQSAARDPIVKKMPNPLPCSDGYVFTSPVNHYPANGLGLFDILGNTREWVHDCYRKTFDELPVDGKPFDLKDPANCKKRVLRSAGWDDKLNWARLPNRGKREPDIPWSGVSFRAVLELN